MLCEMSSQVSRTEGLLCVASVCRIYIYINTIL